MSESVVLVCVAGGETYVRYAEQLMESAHEFFRPTDQVELAILPGVEGWPIGTECRHGIFADWLATNEHDYAFLIDADMRFTGHVTGAILPRQGVGIVAVRHPGYIGIPRSAFPYETRRDSTAFVPADKGERYYAGGFVGGSHAAIYYLSRRIELMIEVDRVSGIEIQWHDESCLNRILALEPPAVALDPRFCCPADATWYRTFWERDYSVDARITALDKTQAERGAR